LLEISEHANDRLKQRKVTRHLVRQCIVKGELVELHDNGREVRRIKVRSKILEAVYLPKKGGFILITAYWTGE
jgi:hypothetical protein